MVLDFYSSESKPVVLPRKRSLVEQLWAVQNAFHVSSCIFVIDDVYLKITRKHGVDCVVDAEDSSKVYRSMSDFKNVDSIVIVQQATDSIYSELYSGEQSESESEYSETAPYYDISDDESISTVYSESL